MKRSVGSASLAVETRRLLRHLDTAKHLRHNTLVAHIFEEHPEDRAHAAIRSAVHHALDAMIEGSRYSRRERALRFRAIVVRYDLGGEPASTVAGDLGLSLRHFYRERQAACVEVGTILRRLLPHASAPPVDAHLYEVSEAAAHTIYLAGAPKRSLAQFLELASSTGDSLARISALCDAAMIEIELYDGEGAKRLIAQAAGLLAERPPATPAARAEASHLIEFARALTLWDRNGGDDAAELAAHTMRRAHRYMTELSASGLRVHAGERMRYAGRLLAVGDPVAAMQLLRESEPFIDLLGQRASYLRIDYANVRCGIEMRTPGAWDEVARLASSAYEEARRQGYLVGAAAAARSLGMLLARAGNARAVEFADAVLEFARNNSSPRMLAYAQIGAAEVYALAGSHDRALALVQSATEGLHGEELQLRRARSIQDRALRRGRKGRKLPRS